LSPTTKSPNILPNLSSFLFGFWIAFVSLQFWGVWIPELRYESAFFELIPKWMTIVLTLIKQVFLNMFIIIAFGAVKNQTYEFGLANKHYDNFAHCRYILLDSFVKLFNNSAYITMNSEDSRRNLAQCLAQYICLSIFVT
jgi:hypothetical protein